MKKREVKPYSKEKSIIILVVGIVLLVVSFACLFTGAILQNNGVESYIYLPLCLSFFPICIFDVIFLIYHQPGMILSDVESQLKTPIGANLETLEKIKYNLNEDLLKEKFKILEQGYLYKRTFNLNKDFINFYIKTIESSNVEQTIKDELNYFDACKFDRYNKCLILFIETNEIKDNDFEIISNLSNYFISLETIPKHVLDTVCVALVDKVNDKAYIIKPGKNKLSFYNACYKFVKKHLL